MSIEPKSTRAPADSKPGIRFVGRYALLGRLASGGMATVHVGRLLGPVGFTRSVAIKRLHPEYARDPSFVSMFLDEARLAAQISHPNVVATLDVVATGGELFLVMDYIHGQSLSWLVKNSAKSGERIPPRIAGAILSGCLQGLHAAHEARDERGVPLNIVHRDVSPQNVMVGADGLARVLDFGVAKAVGRIQNTREGHIKGKLAYMPPEQIQTDVVSRQADVYAAAVVLWEALTGSRLFKAETEAGTLAKILSGTLMPPSKLAPSIPAVLDRVVMRGLERDPAQRYATARAMAIDLERALPMASVAEVSDWLERVAKKELDDRAARIAAIEMTAGLGSSAGMNQLAAALSAATPPEEDTSSDTRRPVHADTLPTAIAPPGQHAVFGHGDDDHAQQQASSERTLDTALGGDIHSGENASQMSSVSLALGDRSFATETARRTGAARAMFFLAGVVVISGATWLALGQRAPAPPAPASAAAAAPPPILPSEPAPPALATSPLVSPPTPAAASAVSSAPAAAKATGPTTDLDTIDAANAAATDGKSEDPRAKQPRKPTRRFPAKPDKPGSPFDNLGGRE